MGPPPSSAPAPSSRCWRQPPRRRLRGLTGRRRPRDLPARPEVPVPSGRDAGALGSHRAGRGRADLALALARAFWRTARRRPAMAAPVGCARAGGGRRALPPTPRSSRPLPSSRAVGACARPEAPTRADLDRALDHCRPVQGLRRPRPAGHGEGVRPGREPGVDADFEAHLLAALDEIEREQPPPGDGPRASRTRCVREGLSSTRTVGGAPPIGSTTVKAWFFLNPVTGPTCSSGVTAATFRRKTSRRAPAR